MRSLLPQVRASVIYQSDPKPCWKHSHIGLDSSERDREAWRRAWRETRHAQHLFSGICEAQRLKPVEAGGGRLEYSAGEGWLACGDAALAFDPLSSQGILSALYGGMLASRTVLRELSGIPATEQYEAKRTAIWQNVSGQSEEHV
jgi:flavin-dependent dehydrogenase